MSIFFIFSSSCLSTPPPLFTYLQTMTAVPVTKAEPVAKKVVAEECIICSETFNKSTRKKIACPYCEFCACSECNQSYLCLDTVTVPKCMNTTCAKEWTRAFISENFTAKFVSKTLKEHREKVLFDKERALLPATQPYVEAAIELDNLKTQLTDIEAQIRALNRKRNDVKLQIYNRSHSAEGAAAPRKQFVCKCPDENCRGFLSTQWKCGLCNKHTCRECRVIKETAEDGNIDNHVCNPDNVATAQLLAKDTKPCPTCATGIFKIDGCDQMFCTQCHTAFSWKTGAIETRIHNPHYFEMLRKGAITARNPAEIRCGRELDRLFLRNISRRLDPASGGDFAKVSDLVQKISHYRLVTIPYYRVDDVENNQALRIKYMRGEITDEAFKTLVQRNNKKREKNREIHDVFHMFTETVTDIMYRLADEANKSPVQFYNPDSHMDEVHRICEYSNECLNMISKVYASKPVVVSI